MKLVFIMIVFGSHFVPGKGNACESVYSRYATPGVIRDFPSGSVYSMTVLVYIPSSYNDTLLSYSCEANIKDSWIQQIVINPEISDECAMNVVGVANRTILNNDCESQTKINISSLGVVSIYLTEIRNRTTDYCVSIYSVPARSFSVTCTKTTAKVDEITTGQVLITAGAEPVVAPMSNAELYLIVTCAFAAGCVISTLLTCFVFKAFSRSKEKKNGRKISEVLPVYLGVTQDTEISEHLYNPGRPSTVEQNEYLELGPDIYQISSGHVNAATGTNQSTSAAPLPNGKKISTEEMYSYVAEEYNKIAETVNALK